VNREIADDKLRDAVRAAGTDLQQACNSLVDLANARGGRDAAPSWHFAYNHETVLLEAQ
jgi:hypothetical protein